MSMPRYAFFDLDGTLIRDTSLLSFQAWRMASVSERDQWAATMQQLAQWRASGVSRAHQNAWFYQRHFAGLPLALAREQAEQWLLCRMAQPGFFHAGTLAAWQALRQQGVSGVMVTGSFREVAQAVGARIGIHTCLCAPLRVSEGCYTGELDGLPMIGEGKAKAVRKFLQTHQADPAGCSGFGDDISDVPYLSLLGQPHAVAGTCAALLQHARQQGWPVL